MKFLEKLDFFKPLGKGLSEADTFMRREMPFNMSWGFPAALVAMYYGGPAAMSAMSNAGSSAGSTAAASTGNGMLQSLGLPANAGQMSSPAFQTSFSPEYLNQLAASQGVSQGEPSYFRNLIGDNEQGLYDQFNRMNVTKMPQMGGMNMGGSNMMSQALRSFGGSTGPRPVELPRMDIPRQQPFVFMPEGKDIQEKDLDIKKLAEVLRKDYGNQI